MASSRNGRKTFQYGMCLNDRGENPCSKAKTKEIMKISLRDEFVCPECGSPLRKCPPPTSTWDKIKKPVIGVAAVAILGGGGFGIYKATQGGKIEKDQERFVAPVDSDSIRKVEQDLKQKAQIDSLENALKAASDREKFIKDSLVLDSIRKGALDSLRQDSIEKARKAAKEKGKSTAVKLSYGNYSGGQREGKPNGTGTISFTRQHTFSTTTGDITVFPGETLTGTFRDGMLNVGELRQRNGNPVMLKGIRIK